MTAFHAAFEAAMRGDDDALTPLLEPGARLDALAVYRNTTAKGRIDALEANYPTLFQMVGEDWFRAAASAFITESPGDAPAMADYGAGFPDWLGRFTPAATLPYLAPCARLDRAWTEAHLAPDAAPLDARAAAALEPALAGLTGRLHPSVKLFWFDWSAPSLWLAHRAPACAGSGLHWRAESEGLLIHRPDGEVKTHPLGRAEWAFLDACRKGRPYGVAAAAAQAVQADLDLPVLFASLIALGVFALPSSKSIQP